MLEIFRKSEKCERRLVMKRILCLALAVIMLVGAVPMNALATEETSVSSTFAGKKVSILSHSASTYVGVSNNTASNSSIGNNDVYYTEG